jgi:peroxiredoxin 2/4
MVTVGNPAPDFRLPGVVNGKRKNYAPSDFRNHWVMLFFYPADFTFICPTEILGCQRRFEDFRKADCSILGISVDSLQTHERWAEELGGLSYPLLSDANGEVARLYSVYDENERVAQRASFVIGPTGAILYHVATSMNVGRSIREIYRVLVALQSGRMCPADWQAGEETGETSLKY